MSELELKNLPSKVKQNMSLTTKSIRNYEVALCITVGKDVTATVAVIEEGHATYATGKLTKPQLREHFSKFDLAIGTHLQEYEQLRTDTMLEEMQESGIEIFSETNELSTRYYMDNPTFKFLSRAEITQNVLVDYLKKRGFSVERHQQKLHIRHLERMRHRNGYIKPKGGKK